MSANVENLNLTLAPFARRLCRLMVVEDYRRPGDDPAFPKLYLSVSQNFIGPTRFDLIRFQPTWNGEPIPFRYEANPALLTLITDKGRLEVCYDGQYLVRFRSDDGLGLQFFMRYNIHELFVDRLDGSYEVGFVSHGMFLFENLSGAMHHNSVWLTPKMHPDDTTVDWFPGDGKLDGYIYYQNDMVERPPLPLRPFDECVAETRADFEAWTKKYAKLPEKYAGVAKYAQYVIWNCHLPPKGLLPNHTIYMMRSGGLTRAMGWHQSYQAMAAWRDVDLCFDLMYSMFSMQDEYGMIPDGASDKEIEYTSTKPPLQGFALAWILDHVGIENVPEAALEKLYGPMCRWVNWWRTFRDVDHDGLIGYCHADESGFDDATIFTKGLPVETPDIAAYLVLCLEACGRIAAQLGKTEESEQHFADSKAMLDAMLKTFWNGEKFICLTDGTHEVIDCESICIYQPIILGKRLPQEIIDKLAEAIGDPERFFTPHGLATESMKSPYYDGGMGGFVLGMSIAPVQLMLTLGLYLAGKKELAVRCAEIWLEESLKNEAGPITVYRAPVPVPMDDGSGFEPVFTGDKLPGGISTWGCAVYLILAEMLGEAEKED